MAPHLQELITTINDVCKEYGMAINIKNRVTTHLEKSGNSKVVREKSGKMEKVRETSGEVKSAEIWLFAQLKYQYHTSVICSSFTRLVVFSKSVTNASLTSCVYWYNW